MIKFKVQTKCTVLTTLKFTSPLNSFTILISIVAPGLLYFTRPTRPRPFVCIRTHFSYITFINSFHYREIQSFCKFIWLLFVKVMYLKYGQVWSSHSAKKWKMKPTLISKESTTIHPIPPSALMKYWICWRNLRTVLSRKKG